MGYPGSRDHSVFLSYASCPFLVEVKYFLFFQDGALRPISVARVDWVFLLEITRTNLLLCFLSLSLSLSPRKPFHNS